MHAGTIIASNYAAMAHVLADSFLRHHPESRFTVLVIDDGEVDLPVGVDVVRLDDLDLGSGEVAMMKTIYDVLEFATSLKPSFLRLLLDRGPAEVGCYLDPDIQVFAAFDEHVEPCRGGSIVLTPHALEPLPRDGLKVDERDIMWSGMYNCGFVAVGQGSRSFLDWWGDRLRFDAVVDVENGLFTDQRWVDWVPSLFDYSICRDPGMNVAWWNIHARPITIGADGPMLADGPVRFVHFSGYDPLLPDVLSKYQLSAPRVEHAEGTAIRTLSDEYAAELVELGHLVHRTTPYRWNVSDDGVSLDRAVRRRVRDGVLDELTSHPEKTLDDRRTPDGFGGGASTLREWLAPEELPEDPVPPVAPAPPTPSRAAMALHVARGVKRRAAEVATAMSDSIAERRRDSSPVANGGSRTPLCAPGTLDAAVIDALTRASPDRNWGPGAPDLDGRFGTVAAPNLAEVLTVADIADVALLVREPRSRLLSHYERARGDIDLDVATWMADEANAAQVDNVVLRALLPASDLPSEGFIPNGDLARLARDAIRRLRELGIATVIEPGDGRSERIGAALGVGVAPASVGIVERPPTRPTDIGILFGPCVPVLAARTAGDSLVWEAAARRSGLAAPRLVADAAWMERIGHTVGVR